MVYRETLRVFWGRLTSGQGLKAIFVETLGSLCTARFSNGNNTVTCEGWVRAGEEVG